MKTHCIYYDLNYSAQQYRILIKYLESYSGFAQVGDRIWFINTDISCQQITDEIRNLPLVLDYKFIVFEVGENWSSLGIHEATLEWMRDEWSP